jgi:hypothetical protein
MAAAILLLGFVALSLPPLTAGGREPRVLDDTTKAGLLFNFAQFVEWPGEAFGWQDELVIGVVGDEELGELLEQNAEGRTVRDMKVRVEPVVVPEEADDCHILYIDAPADEEIEAILASLKAKPVLTVGEDPQFLGMGGAIRFNHGGSKMHFKISLHSAWGAQLHVKSQLMQLAESVSGRR